MPTPSASGLDRAELCPGSMVLPHLDSGEGDPAAAHGSAMHRFLDLIAKLIAQGLSVTDARASALELLEEKHRAVAGAIDLATVPHTQPVWLSEVAMSFDFGRGEAKFHPGVKDRKYPPRTSPLQVFGTADLIGVDGDTLVCLDLKTGWAHRKRPADSLQLLFYAVAAAQWLKCSRARVGYMVLHEDDTVPRYVIEDVDEFALAAAEVRIARLLELKPEVDDLSNFRAGSGCRYCPSSRVCPALVTRLAALKQGPEHALKAFAGQRPLPMVHAEDLPRLLEAIFAAEKVLKQMAKDVKDAVRAVGGVPLPDGYQLAETRITRDTLIAEKAADILDQEFGAGSADKAIRPKFTLTKEAVEDLVRARIQHTGEKLGRTFDAVMERLEEAGAVSTSEFYDVRVHKVKK